MSQFSSCDNEMRKGVWNKDKVLNIHTHNKVLNQKKS